MRRNPVLYKSLVVGVIVLFIGLGIQPAFAIISNTSDSDELNLKDKEYLEIVISKYNSDGTIEKSIKKLSFKKAVELKNKIENNKDKNDILSILQDYEIISKDITDEQLYNEMLKSAEEYDFLKRKIPPIKHEKFVPFAINFLCRIISESEALFIPIGLSLLTGPINLYVMLILVLLGVYAVLLLPSFDILNFLIGHSNFECINGTLPDFVVDKESTSLILLAGFIGYSMSIPFYPDIFSLHSGYCLFTFATGNISYDLPITKYV